MEYKMKIKLSILISSITLNLSNLVMAVETLDQPSVYRAYLCSLEQKVQPMEKQKGEAFFLNATIPYLQAQRILKMNPSEDDNVNLDNDALIIAFLSQAANNGHVDAMYELGTYYYTGGIVERDEMRALNLVKMAASLGHLTAQEFLNEYKDYQ